MFIQIKNHCLNHTCNSLYDQDGGDEYGEKQRTKKHREIHLVFFNENACKVLVLCYQPITSNIYIYTGEGLFILIFSQYSQVPFHHKVNNTRKLVTDTQSVIVNKLTSHWIFTSEHKEKFVHKRKKKNQCVANMSTKRSIFKVFKCLLFSSLNILDIKFLVMLSCQSPRYIFHCAGLNGLKEYIVMKGKLSVCHQIISIHKTVIS